MDGIAVVRAEARASASLIRRPVPIDPGQLGTVRFSWRVPYLIDDADLSDPHSEDSPVRVVLAFDGDRARLSAKNRLVFELAETLSGEAPPYATLMYVWDARAALETVIPGGRSDRVRKLVVDSGPVHLNTWRLHERQIAADFRRAFGEEPGALIGVGLMTDSDNTGSRALAWYGAVRLTDAQGGER